MNGKINFHNSNDLNISNSSEKELNDILTEDLLTYSEDKSQSIINMHQIIENNKIIENNHSNNNSNLFSKNGNEVKKENNFILNNTENKSKLVNKNNDKDENDSKNDMKEKEGKKDNNENNNGNNKDLSALQISLSNLLSDIDSKDLFFIQNNKNKNSLRQNALIDISNENNENVNSSLSYNNNNNTNNNINSKNKNQPNEEQSSVFSICNYSQSLYTSTNNPININNNVNNKINKNNIIINANTSINNNNMIFTIGTIGNNYINSSNTFKKNTMKNCFNYNKEQNINLYINNSNQGKKDNNPINDLNNNENNGKIISPYKPQYKQKYQIEKGENVELSISDNFNKKKFYKESIICNYNKKNNLSINKEQNFTINNISNNIIDNKHHHGHNATDYYDYLKKNNTASLEIIKETTKFNKIKNCNYNHQGIKNKLKLINNKNIDIQKEDSKKFFYNPKLNNNSNRILYMKQTNTNNNNNNNNSNYAKYNKTDYNLNFNKTEISDLRMETFPNNSRVQKLIISKKNQNEKKLGNNKNKTNIYNLSYNYNYNNFNNAKSNKSYIKKNTSTNINTNVNKIINFNGNASNANLKKEEPKNYSKKLFYIKKNKKIISSYNSHNNSSNKKTPVMKIKKNTRNIELSDIDKKNNFSITYNKRNYESKSKSKSKLNEKNIKNECITEPSKQNNKKKYFYDMHKNTNNMTNDFINQIKNSQKKTTSKLLNKLNNLNSNNNININLFSQGTLFPILSNVFDKNVDNSNEKRKINKNGVNVNKNSHSKNKKNNSKGGKSSKQNFYSENTNSKKEKKKEKNSKNNPHKKINTQINILSLLNNFNSKEKNRKNNKSLYNFGNIFFINQSQTIKNGDSYLMSTNNLHEKSIGLNKEKIIIINDNFDSNLNTLNYSNIKQKPQIINDFSNYKKKGNNNKNIDNGTSIVKNSEALFKQKRFDTDINFRIKNNLNMKNKIKDSFKLKKIEVDSGNDIIKGIHFE